jgi:phosphate transport system substrate-binding protein
MVNLLQAWAEAYGAVRSDVAVQVAGGGSGVGIADLAAGLTDIAAASREMTASERARTTRGGAAPVETSVALDAIAVYVHRSNPLESIDLTQLAEIYGDGGGVRRWAQLGASHASCRSDAIVRIGRQSSSGTYAYFRDAVLGPRRDYRLGSIDQSGSKDVVTLVERTPCAIGYSGLAYATPGVRPLRLARRPGAPAIAPSVAAALDASYVLARRLYFYTADGASPATRDFIAWVLGSAGQRSVRDIGFIPVDRTLP